MNDCTHQIATRVFRLGLVILGGLLLVAALLLVVNSNSPVVYAGPIDPPEGFPKLSLSFKTVTPTLAHTGGITLYYAVEIRNTGAYTAANATLTDVIPEGTTYNDDAQASVAPPPNYDLGSETLTWVGNVGFDSTVVVSFSVSVDSAFSGTVRNTAVISHPLIARPVTVTAETVVTDQSILIVEKTSAPPKPGADKPLTYTLVITNGGQPAVNMPVTVTDQVPSNTTSPNPGVDGITDGATVTWTRRITLELGETTVFTFSVDVGNVPSGTVITNDDYQVTSPETGVTAGEPHTVTVVDPIFLLSKEVWPDPPGSNREMTYTLTLLNVGSLATNLVVTDRVPAGVTYQRGGSSYAGGVVSWPPLPSLDTGESAEFTYTAYIGNVMGVPIVNDEYGVCCDEGICQAGDALTSVVQGPNFEALALVDPIAHKPGGGSGTEVTPTLVVHNLGPGNAIDAQATLFFDRISVQASDLYADPPIPALPPFPDGPECGDKCRSYIWVGNLGHGETITFTTIEGQNTIGGEEGTPYTATVVITDQLDNMATEPITATAVGLVTHYANVEPLKSASPVIGRGQLLTYTIEVYNRGLSTLLPPVLTDVVPLSTTFAWASDGGTTQMVSDTIIVSWTLPLLSPGDEVVRTFTVLVNDDLISGTQIINSDYAAFGYGNVMTDAVTSGLAVTTTVQEVGLIDSYKEVTPTMALPGPGNVLTYYVHIVNSSPLPLTDVTVYDLSPWQHSTYQRDAVASAGDVISDIVSVRWTGDVAALSSEVVTFTVLVDPDYQGPITNTAVISHPDLLNEVIVQAVAYITEKPVLRITKSASPDPVERDEELAYTIRIVNLGQQATGLVITDTVPTDTVYVPDSATGLGELVGDQVRWETPVLKPGESHIFEFRVTVGGDSEVAINDQYAVRCAEGVVSVGAPVTTDIVRGGEKRIYLPLIMRNAL
jgi:uncharacterized repeat protein (TIGR01451 family)